jgi:hypothetical protein
MLKIASPRTLRSRTEDTPQQDFVPKQSDSDINEFSVVQGNKQSCHRVCSQPSQTEENVAVNLRRKEVSEGNLLDGHEDSVP